MFFIEIRVNVFRYIRGHIATYSTNPPDRFYSWDATTCFLIVIMVLGYAMTQIYTKFNIANKNKTIVGNRIRQIRKSLNLKGKEFAPRLNISGPSLSELEKGKYYPNFEVLTNICREFNVNLY